MQTFKEGANLRVLTLITSYAKLKCNNDAFISAIANIHQSLKYTQI